MSAEREATDRLINALMDHIAYSDEVMDRIEDKAAAMNEKLTATQH